MKHTFVVASLALMGCINLAQAQDTAKAPPPKPTASAAIVLPKGVTEEMLSPPPVPRFMLETPAKPLTMDEMIQQAREAEQKAGIKHPPAAK